MHDFPSTAGRAAGWWPYHTEGTGGEAPRIAASTFDLRGVPGLHGENVRGIPPLAVLSGLDGCRCPGENTRKKENGEKRASANAPTLS